MNESNSIINRDNKLSYLVNALEESIKNNNQQSILENYKKIKENNCSIKVLKITNTDKSLSKIYMNEIKTLVNDNLNFKKLDFSSIENKIKNQKINSNANNNDSMDFCLFSDQNNELENLQNKNIINLQEKERKDTYNEFSVFSLDQDLENLIEEECKEIDKQIYVNKSINKPIIKKLDSYKLYIFLLNNIY